MSYPPRSRGEVAGRTSNQILHDKLLSIRNGRQGRSRRKNGLRIHSFINLTEDVIFSFAIAAENNAFPASHAHRFMAQSRTEIFTSLFAEAAEVYAGNIRDLKAKMPHEQLPMKMDEWMREKDLQMCVYRYSREVMCARYGITDWHSSYRPNDLPYASDFVYARFLRTNGLMDVPGAEITVEDLVRQWNSGGQT